jgi:hypothetical protein
MENEKWKIRLPLSDCSYRLPCHLPYPLPLADRPKTECGTAGSNAKQKCRDMSVAAFKV